MKTINLFWLTFQFYFPTLEIRPTFRIDLDCVLSAGRVNDGYNGCGLRVLGFGVGVCWPKNEKARVHRQMERVMRYDYGAKAVDRRDGTWIISGKDAGVYGQGSTENAAWISAGLKMYNRLGSRA